MGSHIVYKPIFILQFNLKIYKISHQYFGKSIIKFCASLYMLRVNIFYMYFKDTWASKFLT